MSAPRAKSPTGFYHVVNRGVCLMTIFEDDEDRRAFLRLLATCAARAGIEVHAYCLMSNHYHLLVRDDHDALSRFCRNLNAAYATHFNTRHERTGPLFQSRFHSEVVEDDARYLATLRYIVQNPLKAGLAAPDRYPWSSFVEFGRERSLVEARLAAEMMGGDGPLREFLTTPGDESCLDVSPIGARSDEALRGYLKEEFGCTAPEVCDMEKAARDRILASLRAAGFSVRRIERVTGVSRGIIQKAR